MGQIKSALELALERTKDIAGDKASLEAKELREQGMRLLVKYEENSSFDLKAALKEYPKEKRSLVISGIRQNLESIIALPSGPEALERFKKIGPVFTILIGSSPAMEEYLSQLPGFLQKYLENKEQLMKAAQAQYEPVLRQKEEKLSKQTGRRVQLTFEQDAEFMSFFNKNMEGLNAQFNQVIDQIRDEIRQLLDEA